MSTTVFLALCILGLDVMIYAFFRWIYGDKRSALARQLAVHKIALKKQSARPLLRASERAVIGFQEPPRERVVQSKTRDTKPGGFYKERLA
jgi:hypothetical protein